MGIRNTLISLTDMYLNQDSEKIIVNDIPEKDNFGDKMLSNMIFSVYDEDGVMSTIPRCNCIEGGLSGRFNLGRTCSECGSKVTDPQDISGNLLWLRALEAPDADVAFSKTPTIIPFISPGFWILISKILTPPNNKSIKTKITNDLLLWLCDPHMRYPEDNSLAKKRLDMEELVKYVLDGKRNYVNVINNIENILEFLKTRNNFRDKVVGDNGKNVYNYDRIDNILELYRKSMKEDGGRKIFTDYIPIINKNVFIMEKGPKCKFTQIKASINISVVNDWIRLCREMAEIPSLRKKPLNAERIGRETARVIAELSKMYNEYIGEFCYKKGGLLRKNVGGAKTPWNWRGVIRSIPGPHDRHGVIIPICVAIPLFEPMIINKLLKRNYTMREITNRLNQAILKHDPEIYDILMEIKNEAPDGKPPMLIQRNPSLLRDSINLVYIREIDPDTSNKTIGFSPLIAKYSNADYDGDALNCYLITDKTLLNLLEPFNLKYAAATLSAPYKLTKCLTLLSTGDLIITNYLRDKREDPANDTILSKCKIEGYG